MKIKAHYIIEWDDNLDEDQLGPSLALCCILDRFYFVFLIKLRVRVLFPTRRTLLKLQVIWLISRTSVFLASFSESQTFQGFCVLLSPSRARLPPGHLSVPTRRAMWSQKGREKKDYFKMQSWGDLTRSDYVRSWNICDAVYCYCYYPSTETDTDRLLWKYFLLFLFNQPITHLPLICHQRELAGIKIAQFI